MENPNEKQQPSASISIHADSVYEFREVLGDTIDELVALYDGTNKAIVEMEKERAFARYLRTGSFE